jgi:hypothetical protein
MSPFYDAVYALFLAMAVLVCAAFTFKCGMMIHDAGLTYSTIIGMIGFSVNGIITAVMLWYHIKTGNNNLY